MDVLLKEAAKKQSRIGCGRRLILCGGRAGGGWVGWVRSAGGRGRGAVQAVKQQAARLRTALVGKGSGGQAAGSIGTRGRVMQPPPPCCTICIHYREG